MALGNNVRVCCHRVHGLQPVLVFPLRGRNPRGVVHATPRPVLPAEHGLCRLLRHKLAILTECALHRLINCN